MEEQSPKKEEGKKCSMGDFCWCTAIMGLLIIVLTWWWTPSWANIAITVLAVLIILGASGCCKDKCKPKK